MTDMQQEQEQEQEQIIGFLRQAETGATIKQMYRRGGFSDATFC